MTILAPVKKASSLQDGTTLVEGSKSHLRDMCCRFKVSSSTKRAAIGGDQEQGFEQSFASLAYAYIQDKAPGLLDYLIGFQLVDRNDDNTKAVGIFGFKIGPQWIYAPVFFLNGDLKGHELLYLKSQDAFIPMKENWINYVINKRPHVLGKGEGQQLQQLGVLQPDINSLSQVPENGKFASARPAIKKWANDSGLLKNFGQWVTESPSTRYPGLDERLSLPAFLASDYRFAKLAHDMCESYPWVKQAFAEFHGPTLISDALRRIRTKVASEPSAILQATPQPKQAAADESPKVEIITDSLITENRPVNDENEAKKLLSQGYLVRDHRSGDEVSVVYNTQVQLSLVNPDQTGVFEVLVKDGKFDECLIVHNPHTGRGRAGFCTVVKLEGEERKSHDNFHATRVFIRQDAQSVKSEVSEYAEWFKSLSDTQNLTTGAEYVVVAPNGQGTCVFEVEEDLGDDSYRVYWKDYGGRPDRLDHGYARPIATPLGSRDDECDVIFFNKREGSGFRAVNGKLYLPAESRALRVKNADRCCHCDKTAPSCTCDCFRRDYDDRAVPIRPGNLADIQLQLLQKQAADILAATSEPKRSAPPSPLSSILLAGTKTANEGLFELKIWTDNSEVMINRSRMSKKAGLFHLIRDHGLREKIAKRLIKEATQANGGGQRWYIKYAYGMNPGELGPYGASEGMGMPIDSEMNVGGNTAYGNVAVQDYDPGQYQKVPGMDASMTDPSVYDPMQNIDPNAQQTAQQAYANNQKEVFDTTMISNMLRAVRQDSMVDRYLGDINKALDRLGRILFMFYWHNEEFMDHYGKRDLPELEDTLRNSFEGLGDLVLFLRQKTVEPNGFGEPDLDNAARN